MSPHVYQLINMMCHFIISISYPDSCLTGEGKETCPQTRVEIDRALIIPAAPDASFAHDKMRPSGRVRYHGVVPWDAGG